MSLTPLVRLPGCRQVPATRAGGRNRALPDAAGWADNRRRDLREWCQQPPGARAVRKRGRWPRRRPPEQAGTGRSDPTGVGSGPPTQVLGFACSMPPGQAAWLPDAVMGRVAAVMARAAEGSGPVVAVALDLAAVTQAGQEECAALQALHDRLADAGIRLRLAAASRAVEDRLRQEGVVAHLGADAVHPSLRSALLAGYAALPGPGLVTGSVRNALALPAESLDGAGTRAVGAPSADGTRQAGGRTWWTPQGARPSGRALDSASPAADGAR